MVVAQDRVNRCIEINGKVVYQGKPCAVDSAPAGAAQVGPRSSAPTVMKAEMRQWASGADVMVVSGHAFAGPVTRVGVTHPERPVLLVLTSYQSTQWRVSAAPGTRIKAVVIAAMADSERVDVQAPPQVPILVEQLPVAYETGNIRFRDLIKKLNSRFGVERVLGYHGAYRLPAQIALKGPFAPDVDLTLAGIQPEVPAVRFGFDLIGLDGQRLAFTNTGPRAGKHHTGIVRGGRPGQREAGAGAGAGPLVVRDDGREAFYLDGNGGTLVWAPDGLAGRKQHIAVPRHLPPLSSGTGLAWDQARGVLALVSLGGEGYFYLYDTRKHQWLDARSVQHHDLIGLALNGATGDYVAISDKAELVRFNAKGRLQDVQPLKDVLPDLDNTYDKANGALDSLLVAAQGPATAIVNVRDGKVTHIWTHDGQSGKAQLTYKLAE